MGGEFPSWGSDGNTVYWMLGNTLFTYDIVAAETLDKEIEDFKEAEKELRLQLLKRKPMKPMHLRIVQNLKNLKKNQKRLRLIRRWNQRLPLR